MSDIQRTISYSTYLTAAPVPELIPQHLYLRKALPQGQGTQKAQSSGYLLSRGPSVRSEFEAGGGTKARKER